MHTQIAAPSIFMSCLLFFNKYLDQFNFYDVIRIFTIELFSYRIKFFENGPIHINRFLVNFSYHNEVSPVHSDRSSSFDPLYCFCWRFMMQEPVTNYCLIQFLWELKEKNPQRYLRVKTIWPHSKKMSHPFIVVVRTSTGFWLETSMDIFEVDFP